MDNDEIYEHILEDITKIVLVDKPEWPKDFTKEMKLDMYDLIMDYWSALENYPKCDQIQNKIDEL